MLVLEWNALREGDHVLVHDDTSRGFTLHEAVVVVAGRGRNGIAVRTIGPGVDGGLMRPRRLAVHLMPVTPTEPCWRCDVGSAGQDPARAERAGGER
jgi:hypothetical protein